MTALDAFLAAAGWADAARRPLADDASTRRYSRLERPGASAVLMQAPADAALDAFVAVGGLLAALGLSVPRLLAEDRSHGLLLLEDFGDDVFTRLLAAGEPAPPLYDLAVDVLVHLHRRFDAAAAPALRRYDAPTFLDQVMLFAEVTLPRALPAEALAAAGGAFRQAWAEILPAACDGPQSLLLRDYHAGNLVRLAGREGVAACGLLDFQDAGIGPRAYDLVSLLEDARLDLPAGLAARARRRYLAAFPELDREAFAAASAALAAMRHLRVVAVFQRLARAGRPDYLVHLPRLWRLIESHLATPALRPLAAWFEAWLPAARRRNLSGGGGG